MELRAYIEPLLKWWWLIVVSMVLAAGSSYYVVKQQPDRYYSSTTLMVGRTIDDPNPNSSQFFLSQQLAGIYADMAKRELVVNATKEALGLEWLPEFSAWAIPQTQLLEIGVVDYSPERAQIVANELAIQLIRMSPSSIGQEEQDRQEFIAGQLNDLQRQIEATTEQINVKSEELGEQFSAREISEIQGEISALENKRNTLQSNYARLLESTQQGAVNAISVIDPASLPTRPMSSGSSMAIITAVAGAMALAAGTAYVIEYLDDSIKANDDIAKLFNIPKLVAIPHSSVKGGEDSLITLKYPLSHISESFRSLRTNIQFSNVDKDSRILLITSAQSSDGKSFIAANLAIIMAKAGDKVVLVDADLRRPTQHLNFNIPQSNGLSSLLLQYNKEGQKSSIALIEEYTQQSWAPNLDIIVSGVIPPTPAELVGSQKMANLLDDLLEKYDYVVIDSPPVMAVTDAVILSSRAHATILVSSLNITRRGHIKETLARLAPVNGHVTGLVLNRDKSKSRGYYSSEYYIQPEPATNTLRTKIGAFVESARWAKWLSRPLK